MRCNTHRKEFEGVCNWCGKKLCPLCIAKQEGRKYYCEACAVALVPFKREKLPAVEVVRKPPIAAQEPQAIEEPAVKKMFVLGKDGYFELK
ncbi:MAG: hypothetical protein QXT19_00375 [Candidatus Woesearchaeota archaeon]